MRTPPTPRIIVAHNPPAVEDCGTFLVDLREIAMIDDMGFMLRGGIRVSLSEESSVRVYAAYRAYLIETNQLRRSAPVDVPDEAALGAANLQTMQHLMEYAQTQGYVNDLTQKPKGPAPR